MAIELIQGVNDTPTQGNNTVTLSNSIQDGDLAIAVHSHLHSSTLPTAPDGFELIDNQSIGSSRATLWQKELSAADAGSTITFESLNVDSSLSIVVLRGAAINVYDVFAQTTNNISSTIPAVTASVPDSIHYAFYATEGRHNPTTPAGWTLVVDSPTGTYDPNRTEIWKWDTENLPANTSSGTQSVSGSMSDGKVVWRVAFEPVAAPVNDSYDADTPTATLNALEAEVVIGTSARNDVETPNASLEAYDVAVETIENIVVEIASAQINLDAQDDEASGGASVIVPTATISVDSHDASPNVTEIRTVEILPSSDFSVNTHGTVRSADTTEIPIGYYSDPRWQHAFFLFDELPVDFEQEGLVSASFKLTTSARSTTSKTGISVLTDIDHENYYNSTSVGEVEGQTGNSDETFDITDNFSKESFRGIRVWEASTTNPNFNGRRLASSEYPDEERRPRLVLTYMTGVPVVTASTPNVGVESHNAEVIARTDTDVNADEALINIRAHDVTPVSGLEVSVDSASASLGASDVEVESFINPDVFITAASAEVVMSGSATADVFIPVTVNVGDTDTVMFGAYESEIEVTLGERIELDTPRILYTHHQVAEVQGEPVLPTEEEDPYFVSTMRTLTGVQRGISGGMAGMDRDTIVPAQRAEWFRFNERSGTVARDRAYLLTEAGSKQEQDILDLHNVVIGLNNGPEGRANFHFNGDAFAKQREPGSDNGDPYISPSSLEFTFRTERKTQFIMGGADELGGNRLSAAFGPAWELWLNDGVFEVRVGNSNSVVARGYTDLADGQWHHLVLQNSHLTGAIQGYNTFSFEAYVDGRLEIRRRQGTPTAGFPDYIGGRDTNIYDAGYNAWREVPALAKSHWFLGDITEVVHRNGRVLTADEISIQRDNVMGIRPIRVDSARLSTAAGETVSTKGNVPRVLVLDFAAAGIGVSRGVFSVGSQAYSTAEMLAEFDINKSLVEIEFPGYGDTEQPGIPSVDNERYLWFRKSVISGDDGQYRDEITDNYRLVDLNKDLNMDDYDIISIIKFPGTERDWLHYDSIDARNMEPKVPMRVQVEHLLAQIRSQVVHHGKSLIVTDPFSAVGLGIINRVEYVPGFIESIYMDSRLGAVAGMYNMHALRVDPFFGANPEVPHARRTRWTPQSSVSSLKRAASRYDDLDANIKQRVVTPISGLTDLPGWIHVHGIRWWNVNPFATMPYTFHHAFEDRSVGLRVGDEFYMNTAVIYPSQDHANNIRRRRNGDFVATPFSAIRVGKPITAFARSFYASLSDERIADGINVESTWGGLDAAVGNPYYEHAISIAVEPGDMWDGEPVSGKVYVNFTEADVNRDDGWQTKFIMQMDTRFPNELDSRTIGVGDVIRFPDGTSFTLTPQHLKYQYSSFYGTGVGSKINLPSTGGSGPDWGWSPGGERGSSGGAGGGYAMNYFWESSVPMEEIPVPTITNRAMRWLSSNIDIAGQATVHVNTPEITDISTSDVEVESYANVEVGVGTARTTVEAHNDADTISPNVTIMVATPALSTRALSPVTEFFAETAKTTLYAGEVRQEEVEIPWSESLVLTMPTNVETLILEEIK